MSHLVQIVCKVHDPTAISAACKRLGLAEPVQGTAKLFSGEAAGLLLQLPGWTYPAVIDPLSGTIRYDNFEGRWGESTDLMSFYKRMPLNEPLSKHASKAFAVPSRSSRTAASSSRFTQEDKMSRRRIVRPVSASAPMSTRVTDPRRLTKLRECLKAARRGFDRWLSRLKRAGNAVAKQQAQITRLERKIKSLEEP